MKRFNHLIVQWPKLTLLFGLLLTSFFAYHASHLRIDSSVQNLYAQNDPNKKYYDEVSALFGSDDMAVIGLITGNVYTPATLEKIESSTEWRASKASPTSLIRSPTCLIRHCSFLKFRPTRDRAR